MSVVLGEFALRTRARIRRLPTAPRPWLVTIRLDGMKPRMPRSFNTFEEARAHALHETGLDRRDTSEPNPDSPDTTPAGTETEGNR